MARNSSGTFTRIAGALTGNNIYSQEQTAGVNVNYQSQDSEHNDIATELTDSLSRTGKGGMLANLSMGNFKIVALGNATAPTDAINKGQVDAGLDGKLNLTGGTLTGALTMSLNKILFVGNGTDSTDAVNKGQLDTKLSLTGGTMTGGIVPSGSISLGATVAHWANVYTVEVRRESTGNLNIVAKDGNVELIPNENLNARFSISASSDTGYIVPATNGTHVLGTSDLRFGVAYLNFVYSNEIARNTTGNLNLSTTAGNIELITNGSLNGRFTISSASNVGSITPATNNTHLIGSTSLMLNSVYTRAVRAHGSGGNIDIAAQQGDVTLSTGVGSTVVLGVNGNIALSHQDNSAARLSYTAPASGLGGPVSDHAGHDSIEIVLNGNTRYIRCYDAAA